MVIKYDHFVSTTVITIGNINQFQVLKVSTSTNKNDMFTKQQVLSTFIFPSPLHSQTLILNLP